MDLYTYVYTYIVQYICMYVRIYVMGKPTENCNNKFYNNAIITMIIIIAFVIIEKHVIKLKKSIYDGLVS